MAKNMARIKDGVVVNIEWCSDRQQETETLINLVDRPVGIGDTYDGVDFYRNEEKVLSPWEKLQKLEEEHLEELGTLIEEIYINDMEVIENV